jgi:predicted nucleic acid-binding protein
VYLLDTNIVSEMRKLRPHGGVTAWLRDVDDRQLYISAVTLGELQAGVELTREQDAEKALEIEAFIDRIADTLNLLPMTREAFRVWAKLMHRKSDALTIDAMIAATAWVHELKVVTRNVKDFRSFGVEIINPYSLR